MTRSTDKRYPYFAEVTIESASGRREARISDISHGGCFIDSIAEVHPGEEVLFHFKDQPLTFRAIVVYSLPGVGFGLRFAGLDSDAQAHLDSVLKGFESSS